MELLKTPKHTLHILVCINNRINLPGPKKPDCGPKISQEELKQLKSKLKENGLNKKVKITKTSCLGICSKNGPTIMVYPGQEYYTINSVKDIEDLIELKLSKLD